MDAGQTGKLIAQRRNERGLSQAELALRLHVTDKAVSRWETGRGMPALDTLEPLAKELGISVSELLSGQILPQEEISGFAGRQIVAGLRKNRKMLLLGGAAVLTAVLLMASAWLGYHYVSSVNGGDLTGLARTTGEGLDPAGRTDILTHRYDPETLEVTAMDSRGDYMAVLCVDSRGEGCMGLYERDTVFEDRWRLSGGTIGDVSGKMGSYHLGERGNAVLVFYGQDLPEEAAGYTFTNSGITYICPVREGKAMDLFLVPDTVDINGVPVLVGEDQQPLQ